MGLAASSYETMKIDNWRKTYPWLQGIAYFCQRFSLIGTGIYMRIQMAQWGIPAAEQASLTALLVMPLYIKMIPGLLSDRVPIGRWGRRKPYIALGGLLYIPAYLILLSTNEFNTQWVTGIIAVVLAWVFVDTTLDALAVDVTPQDKTAVMQSAATGGGSLGAALSYLLVTNLGASFGWTAALILLCVLSLLQAVAALLYKEIPLTKPELKEQLPLREVMRTTFGTPLAWSAIAFMMLFTAGTGGISNLVSIYLLTEQGWSKDPALVRVFGVLGALQLFSTALGALIAGRLPARYYQSLRFYAGFILLFWVLGVSWLVAYRNPGILPLIFVAFILLGLGLGMGGVMSNSIAMRVSPKSIEGFMFATLMSVHNFGNNFIAAKTVAAFAPRFGSLVPAFFMLIPYALLSLIFLNTVLKRLPKKQQPPPIEAEPTPLQ